MATPSNPDPRNNDPNMKLDTMCPIRSGTDMLTTQEAPTALAGLGTVPGKINVQVIPKRAPCMRDCAVFDKANDQCMAKTVLDGLAKVVSGKGLNLFGGISGP